MKDPYLPWRARIRAVESFISNDKERKETLSIALRHIARHRGWRNPYSSISSLAEQSEQNKDFYKKLFVKIEEWKADNGLEPGWKVRVDPENSEKLLMPDWGADEIWGSRPTPAELVKDFLEPVPGVRIRANHVFADGSTPDPSVQVGKLHQSDYYYEVSRILQTQQVDDAMAQKILQAVFTAKSPRGAAAALVGYDDLQPTKHRALRAALAYQRYLVISTIKNLRIKEESGNFRGRSLTDEEQHKLYTYLTSEEVAQKGDVSWFDVADQLSIERSQLKGVGGITRDGTPISAKVPPYLTTEYKLFNAPGIRKELRPLAEWLQNADELDKEWLIESLSNAGVPEPKTDAEHAAKNSVDELFEEISALDESALEKLDSLSLASGRAAYSIDTLQRLTKRMLEAPDIDLHEARKLEFGVADDWHPTPKWLGEPTGNPAVDRTIKIVSRWLKAVVKEWGVPVTVNIEHGREGFSSPKVAREQQRDMDKRYQARKEESKKIAEALSADSGENGKGQTKFRNSDIRKWRALQRQNCQCLYCGKQISMITTQMDHIVPREGVGSTNELANLVAVCADCNLSKSNHLFSTWAGPERLAEAKERVDSWMPDGYLSGKRLVQYKRDVKSRLEAKEVDEPLDNRSIESVAWMALEIREQIQGYLFPEGGQEAMKRVNVHRGWITAAARKASGLEKQIHWIGGGERKSRLDRRHHAIDASTIAFLRPGVRTVLVTQDNLKRAQQDLGDANFTRFFGFTSWKDYKGEDSDLFARWKDQQMAELLGLLNEGLDNDQIPVTRPVRLRLGVGRAHEDTVYPLLRKKVGDALSVIAIDKASTPALWMALTSHPDYDKREGLPEDRSRRIRIHDRWLDAQDDIGFLCEKPEELDAIKNAVYTEVRGGFAAIGNAIHHARFYRLPKMNSRGVQTGWLYAYLRVFQQDLLKSRDENLFSVELPPQSSSRRSADAKLRKALDEGTAEYLGWAVAGDEIEIDPTNEYFSPEGSSAINKFMRVYPNTSRFKIVGFPTRDQIRLSPSQMASEGLGKDAKSAVLLESDDWTESDNSNALTIFGDIAGLNGSWHPSVDTLLTTHPQFIRRNTLGQERWYSKSHMPTSWRVSPHPEF